MNGAHLVGDRADAADAGGDVRRFRVGTPAQECLEEPRRLEDAKLRVAHLAVADDDGQRALALDAREVVDLDRLTCHGDRLPRGMRRRWR